MPPNLGQSSYYVRTEKGGWNDCSVGQDHVKDRGKDFSDMRDIALQRNSKYRCEICETANRTFKTFLP